MRVQALKGLKSRLGDVQQYLDAVLAGTLPANNEVLGLIQDMFNLLPNLNVSALSQSLTGARLVPIGDGQRELIIKGFN